MTERTAPMPRWFLLFPFILLICSLALAQGTCPRNETPVQMQIQLTLEKSDSDGSSSVGVANAGNSSHGSGSASIERSHEFSPNMNIRVELQDSFGTRVGDGVPNGEGRVSFSGLCPRSEFRLRVTGTYIEETTAENLSPSHGDRMVNLTLHRKGDKAAVQKSDNAAISAAA